MSYNFKQRVAIGETMDPKQLEAEVRGLLADQRSNALLGLIKQHREAYVAGGSAQSMAGDPGKLAHCSGSVFALDTLLQALDALGTPPKRRGGQAPPQESAD